MKNLSIALSVLVVLVVGALGIRYGIQRSKAPDIEKPSDVSESITATSSLAEVIPEREKSADELLRSAAMRIIDRPVAVKVQLSDATKKLALDKIKEASDLIRANYDYVNPWYDLGAYRKLIGDYDGAIEAWSFVRKIRPSDYIAYHNLGDMHAFTLKNYAKGAEYFLESIARNPQNVDAYIQLGVIYEFHLKDRFLEIEPLLLNGIGANPKDINLKIALARYYQKAGNLESARLYFEKALALSPGNKAIEEELKSLGN